MIALELSEKSHLEYRGVAILLCLFLLALVGHRVAVVLMVDTKNFLKGGKDRRHFDTLIIP